MLHKGIEHGEVDGTGKKIGVVYTCWNAAYIDVLRERVTRALCDHGVSPEDIVTRAVPGAFELARGAQELLETYSLDAIVCLGVLIKGETMHFEYIADATAQGIMRVGLDAQTPVIFGVLTCLNEQQVLARIDAEGQDHGYEWGKSALMMCQARTQE
jgi:6,7-dimethyl-8-ribityllumazine synthase